MTARDTAMTIRRPSPQRNGVLAGAVLRGSTKIVALLALSVALIGAFVAIEPRSLLTGAIRPTVRAGRAVDYE